MVRTDGDGNQKLSWTPLEQKVLNNNAWIKKVVPGSLAENIRPKEIAVDTNKPGQIIVDVRGNLYKVIAVDQQTGSLTCVGIDADGHQLLRTATAESLQQSEDTYAVLPQTESNDGYAEKLVFRTDKSILGEGENTDFNVGAQFFSTESGIIVAAASDKGIGYKAEKPNQDRVIVDPQNDLFAVIDGVGGKPDGHRASQIVAENMLNGTGTVGERATAAITEMADKQENGGLLPGAEAGFISAQIIREDNQLFIEEHHCGDCSLFIFDENGDPVFEAENDSMVDRLQKMGTFDEETALLHPNRNQVLDSLSTDPQRGKVKSSKTPVKPGYRVLLASDGIGGNLTKAEIAELIKGLSIAEATLKLGATVSKRMELAVAHKSLPDADRKAIRAKRSVDGVYEDNFRSPPKSDNRSMVMFDVK